jgi:ubiquinone/menaquinone biosynthesis C-methylase UbiE
VTESCRGSNAAETQRWNGESGQYWIAHRERHQASHRRLVPHLFTAAAIMPGECVLDVGCGCGATTIKAAQAAQDAPAIARLPGLRLDGAPASGGVAIGMDLSAPMLKVAARLAIEAGAVNARFVQGDAQAAPVIPGSFDAVISSFGVMFFDDPGVAFSAIAAAVRHRGRLAFLCWQHDDRNELLAIPLRAFATRTRLTRSATADLFTDARQIADLLSGAGWEHVQVKPVVEPAWLGADVADVMRYVRGMPLTRSLIVDLRDKLLAERLLASVAEQYAARERPDGVWVRAAAWLVTARRP